MGNATTEEEMANQELKNAGENEGEDMADMTETSGYNSLLGLPNEVLETICCHLDIQSLCSLSQVCWRLHNIQESDRVWRATFYKRFVLVQSTKCDGFVSCIKFVHHA